MMQRSIQMPVVQCSVQTPVIHTALCRHPRYTALCRHHGAALHPDTCDLHCAMQTPVIEGSIQTATILRSIQSPVTQRSTQTRFLSFQQSASLIPDLELNASAAVQSHPGRKKPQRLTQNTHLEVLLGIVVFGKHKERSSGVIKVSLSDFIASLVGTSEPFAGVLTSASPFILGY